MKPPEAVRELTEFQQLVCDLAGDLIINGGDRRHVRRLLAGVIGHYWQGRCWRTESSPPDALIKRDLKRWKARLARHWPSQSDRKPEPEPPRTVSEMMRANVRDVLKSDFENFIGNGQIHELYFFSNVLQFFENITRGPDSEKIECPLAEAFMAELESDCTYIKVSLNHVEAVKQYIEQLKTTPDEDGQIDELTKLWNRDPDSTAEESGAK